MIEIAVLVWEAAQHIVAKRQIPQLKGGLSVHYCQPAFERRVLRKKRVVDSQRTDVVEGSTRLACKVDEYSAQRGTLWPIFTTICVDTTEVYVLDWEIMSWTTISMVYMVRSIHNTLLGTSTSTQSYG